MAISAAGIIFSNLNDNTLSRLTSDRTVAAIPFACRYRLVDFALSNLANANISNINIVANYNYRSLTEHIGSGKDWDLARRKGGINIISPYQTGYHAGTKMFATHMEALVNIKEYIDEFKEEYVILIDSDSVLNIDLEDVVRTHEESRASVTIVTSTIGEGYSSKHTRCMLSSENGKVTDISLGTVYNGKNNEVSLGILVVKTVHLRRIIEDAIAHDQYSLTSILLNNYKTDNFVTYNYKGYAASISSFLDYYRCSMELVKNEEARASLIDRWESPIFTKVHNSSPVVYKSTAHVEGSMIADECVIEGTVINSVLFRGVKVEKGAVVKNCVLFRGTHVGKNASLNCIVTDKDVYVSDGVQLSGNDNMPFYVQKFRKI